MTRQRIRQVAGGLIAGGVCVLSLVLLARGARVAQSAPATQGAATQVPQLRANTQGIVAPSDVAAPPESAERTPSGVASLRLEAATSKQRPQQNDRVVLEYTSFRRDGQLLGSSRLRGEPTPESVRSLIPGVAEVVRQMGVGERRRVWVPAALSFANDETHKPKFDLTVDVRLLRIVAAPEAPLDLKSPAAGARHTPSGLAYQTVKRGKGSERPTDRSRVRFLHSGWNSEGILFESSQLADHPETSAVAELLPGLREGLALMKAGDKLRFWVPEQLAFGAHPRRRAPKGLLTFEVELLEVLN